MREDKPAEEIVLEESAETALRAPTAAELEGHRAGPAHPSRAIPLAEDGITKQGLADFYADIADWILPHITGRVLSLVRCPSGNGEKCFFAKHPWAGLSDAVHRVDVGEEEPMLAIDDLTGLLELVQAGVVEIHPWGSRADNLEQPDRLIFDLDPGEDVAWRAVIDGGARGARPARRARAQELRQDDGRQGSSRGGAGRAGARLG